MVDGVRIFWKDETGILRDTTDVVNGYGMGDKTSIIFVRAVVAVRTLLILTSFETEI